MCHCSVLQGVEVPGESLRGTVDGLVEGREYEFRVKARNKAGLSEPSMVSPVVKTKARKGRDPKNNTEVTGVLAFILCIFSVFVS